MSLSESITGLGELAKAITGYFNPSAYESRVLRGLVKTGDKMAEYQKKYLKEEKAGDVSPKTRKYLLHYSRKWRTDRLKLS